MEDPTAAIGRHERAEAFIDPDKVAALAATLDLEGVPGKGGALPPGWHWMFFNPFMRRSRLGPDGHPARGNFLPETGLPRRMWAGGRLTYRAPLPLGARITRDSEILNVVEKTGGSGRLVFVTVRHVILHEGVAAIEEEQDIVYRAPAAPGTPAPKPAAAPENPVWSEEAAPDPVLLFRYSALTSNGHRIHYDQPYARNEEGYRDLVVHGPLIATLLQGLAGRSQPGRALSRFEFRAMAPLFVDRPFHLEAAESAEGLSLWARGPEGELAMRAEARFAEGEDAP